MRAVKAMKESAANGGSVKSESAKAPAEPRTREQVLNDDKLNDDIMGAFPGATITNIQEGRRK